MLILPPLGATTSWLCTSKAAMACNCLVARSVRSSCIFTTNALKEAGWRNPMESPKYNSKNVVRWWLYHCYMQQKRG